VPNDRSGYADVTYMAGRDRNEHAEDREPDFSVSTLSNEESRLSPRAHDDRRYVDVNENQDAARLLALERTCTAGAMRRVARDDTPRS